MRPEGNKRLDRELSKYPINNPDKAPNAKSDRVTGESQGVMPESSVYSEEFARSLTHLDETIHNEQMRLEAIEERTHRPSSSETIAVLQEMVIDREKVVKGYESREGVLLAEAYDKNVEAIDAKEQVVASTQQRIADQDVINRLTALLSNANEAYLRGLRYSETQALRSIPTQAVNSVLLKDKFVAAVLQSRMTVSNIWDEVPMLLPMAVNAAGTLLSKAGSYITHKLTSIANGFVNNINI